MISINCEGCPNHCCGKNPYLAPILIPSEEEIFVYKSRVVKTPFREMRMLNKGFDGICVFLDDKMRCSIYDERPLECRLYPFVLDFEFGIAVRLDKRFCQSLSTLNYDRNKISALLREHSGEFKEDWIKGYVSLEDC
jgi:Fe-S-cluster containining protein